MPTAAVRLPIAALLFTAVAGVQAVASDDRADERQRLVQAVAAQMRETGSATGRPALSERVMTVMRQVPRHAFVPEDQRPYAYVNRPLPIGHGQTISQPYIVALMTELAQPQPDHKEIGRAHV